MKDEGYNNLEKDDPDISVGYIGLIGAIIRQAMKDYKQSYARLVMCKDDKSYWKFNSDRLFFINNCNGYTNNQMSSYLYEKAQQEAEKPFSNSEIRFINEYIRMKDKQNNISNNR